MHMSPNAIGLCLIAAFGAAIFVSAPIGQTAQTPALDEEIQVAALPLQPEERVTLRHDPRARNRFETYRRGN